MPPKSPPPEEEEVEMSSMTEHPNESQTRLIRGEQEEQQEEDEEETLAIPHIQYRKPKKREESRIIKYLFLLTIPAILGLLFYLVMTQSTPAEERDASPGAAPTGFTYPSGFDMKNNWGSYSPYFGHGTKFDGIESSNTLEDSGKVGTHSGLPPKCRYKQVHVLHRHAERFPTKAKADQMKAVAKKLKNMQQPPISKKLEWILDWEYSLGTDLLVPKGVSTEFESGSRFWASHGTLLYNATAKGRLFYDDDVLNRYDNGTKRNKPVIRATTQSRIHTSAKAWAAGFFGVYGNQEYTDDDDDDLYKLVLMDEVEGQNNTLASYYSCPNGAENKSSKHEIENKIRQWTQVYLSQAEKRLQKLLPDYDNLTTWDAYAMQHICAFETATYDGSPFCGLFTESEWRGYEYTHDLDFYYQSGFGNVYAPAIGAGWLTELAARMKGVLISQSSHGVNTTLTNSTENFPLDQPFYMDMTHDAVIVAVLTALDLKFLDDKLPINKMVAPRSFIISRLTPFGARLYVELLECDDESPQEMFVRLKLNDRVLPLGDLPHCPDSKNGFCPFDKFRKSLERRLKDIHFEELCYGPKQ